VPPARPAGSTGGRLNRNVHARAGEVISSREGASMGVAGHLRIDVEEYDARIRAFVPGYEELVSSAARAVRFVPSASPVIVDLGIGTGALAAACLAIRPSTKVIGIDSDEAMLNVARARLGGMAEVELIAADFTRVPIPPCDALVACLSLHHIRTAVEKKAFYTKCFAALRPSGIVVSADCFPGRDKRVAARHREAWLEHLQKTCTRAEAERHLEAWADEDVYWPLEDELDWLRAAGFGAEVLWRQQGFAVVAGFMPAP
jgi:SAM-dependent methyltransferase